MVHIIVGDKKRSHIDKQDEAFDIPMKYLLKPIKNANNLQKGKKICNPLMTKQLASTDFGYTFLLNTVFSYISFHSFDFDPIK